jgi:hypothetical protein
MKKKLLVLFLIGINVLTAQVPSYVPTNGLVGYWPFNGNANDESGNGNNGIVNGATLTSDRLGAPNSAYNFNGDGQYIQAPNQSLQGSVSFSGWYKMTTYNLSQNDVFFFANNSPSNSILDCNFAAGYRYDAGTGQHGHSVYPRSNSNLTGYYALNQIPEANVWHHFVCVFENGVSVKMYLDNNLFYTNNTVISNSSLLSLPMLIGYAGLGYSFTGQLDDIGIWNRALTQEEITNLYNSSMPQTACLPAYVPTNGLMGYWPFCGNANDESGNGNNGTVNGAVLTNDRFNSLNSSYLFTGTSNKISITNPFFNNGWANYTISIWFNPSSNLSNGILINTNPHDGIGIAYSQYGTNKKLYHSKNSDTSAHLWDILSGDPFNYPSFEFNIWYNILIIKSNNTYYYYVNGTLDKTTSSTISPIENMCGLIFGNIAPGYNAEPLNGKLDDIGIWSRALTQEEITGLYTTLGTTQTEGVNQIAIYPNPAKDHVTIDCGNISSVSGWRYKIVNTLGQEVSNGVMNSQQNIISLNTLNSTGVYFVKIYDASNNLLNTKKIILQ